jgi:DNA repair protein RecO (recombination protein O)
MALIKTESIVLHSRKQGESSKIIILYTRHHGKLHIIVKGSRQLKSRHWGMMEPFSHANVLIYYRSNRDLHYLKEADSLHSFSRIHAHLGKLALAAIPCEILMKAEERDHPNSQVFDLLLETLSTLEARDSGLRHIIRAFEWHYLVQSGFKPDISSCDYCGRTTPSHHNYFALDKGTITCSDCGVVSEQTLTLSDTALDYLRWLDKIPVQQSYRATLSSHRSRELDQVLMSYMRFHIESVGQLKSVKILESITNELGKKSENQIKGSSHGNKKQQ